MHRFTAQLALIAYLIGGWLLPAAHHHGHDHAYHDGQCVCHSGADGGGGEGGVGEKIVSSEQGNGCCCEHHSDPTPTETESVAQSTSDLMAGNGPLSQCDGLCALCCTVSLVGSTPLQPSIAIVPDVDTGKPVVTGLAWPLLPLPSGISSRGPPTV